MPEYLSPGVYVEEVASGPRPIEGVGTSTAGFCGLTERGPSRPKLVSNWGEYVRWFGDTIDTAVSFMPQAVRGFFENGGRRAFIARVISLNGAVPALVDLATQDAGGAPIAGSVLRVTANGAGAWGNNILIWVRRATRANTAVIPPRDWFRITVLYYRDGVPNPFVDPTNPANLANPMRREPQVLEDFDDLTFVDGRTNHVVGVINSASKLIEVAYVDPATGLPSPSARPTNIGSGGGAALFNLATAAAGTTLRVQATGPGVWGNGISVTVAAGATAATFRIDISDATGIVETYDNIPDATPALALGRVNGSSARVRLSWQPAGAAPARPNDVAATLLAGGVNSGLAGGNNGAPINAGDFAGNPAVAPNLRTGLAGLELIDEVNLLMAPDEVTDAQIRTDVIGQCERLRDRFAILSIDANNGDVQNILPPQDSSYGAVYYPWIRIFDTRIQDTILVPPTGHVAGIYARTDIERGVHKAPANEVVRGMVYRDINSVRKPLEFDIGKGGQDILNPRGVNVIRDFRPDGRSIRVWGARTMSSDPLWRYVNVRRLFLFVEESIDEGTQWVVFEPNDETTWARVRQSISNFLLTVWRNGALRGLTQEEAFFVRCDRTTMTEAEIDAGMLICEIGIAPVKPAEFVIFRIQQKTLEQTA